MSKPHNGFPSWNAWNVSLWLNNDGSLYGIMQNALRLSDSREKAARYVKDTLTQMGLDKTPDGAPYSLRAIRLAMRD